MLINADSTYTIPPIYKNLFKIIFLISPLLAAFFKKREPIAPINVIITIKKNCNYFMDLSFDFFQEQVIIYDFFTLCVSQPTKLNFICRLLQSHSHSSFGRLRSVSKIIYYNLLLKKSRNLKHNSIDKKH